MVGYGVVMSQSGSAGTGGAEAQVVCRDQAVVRRRRVLSFLGNRKYAPASWGRRGGGGGIDHLSVFLVGHQQELPRQLDGLAGGAGWAGG